MKSGVLANDRKSPTLRETTPGDFLLEIFANSRIYSFTPKKDLIIIFVLHCDLLMILKLTFSLKGR